MTKTPADSTRRALRTLVLIWLAWAALVIGFQALVDWRLVLNRPDRATIWTPQETARNSQRDKPYLLEPFMNHQVSWDSEFYLAIAIGGYDDPQVRQVELKDGSTVSMSYAFFPFYPAVMAGVSVPLRVLGLNPVATATLSGVLVSLVGALFGMAALFDLTHGELGDEGGIRTAFYFLIFPTGFFLAQVYTEGLFAGLAFGSLALVRRQQFWLAGLLAALATWTRSTGLALIVPLALAWAQTVDWRGVRSGGFPRRLLDGLAVLLPLGAYLIWAAALGARFNEVQITWFGRGIFNWDGLQWGLDVAATAFREGSNTQMMVYYALEAAAVLLALAAGLVTLRRYPGAALFSLIALALAVTSGAPQSLIRYVLTMPAVFIFLAQLGRSVVVDKAWTILSILLLGMQAMLFSLDMWVA